MRRTGLRSKLRPSASNLQSNDAARTLAVVARAVMRASSRRAIEACRSLVTLLVMALRLRQASRWQREQQCEAAQRCPTRQRSVVLTTVPSEKGCTDAGGECRGVCHHGHSAPALTSRSPIRPGPAVLQCHDGQTHSGKESFIGQDTTKHSLHLHGASTSRGAYIDVERARPFFPFYLLSPYLERLS